MTGLLSRKAEKHLLRAERKNLAIPLKEDRLMGCEGE
jgi:hypothetical protein